MNATDMERSGGQRWWKGNGLRGGLSAQRVQSEEQYVNVGHGLENTVPPALGLGHLSCL